MDHHLVLFLLQFCIFLPKRTAAMWFKKSAWWAGRWALRFKTAVRFGLLTSKRCFFFNSTKRLTEEYQNQVRLITSNSRSHKKTLVITQVNWRVRTLLVTWWSLTAGASLTQISVGLSETQLFKWSQRGGVVAVGSHKVTLMPPDPWKLQTFENLSDLADVWSCCGCPVVFIQWKGVKTCHSFHVSFYVFLQHTFLFHLFLILLSKLSLFYGNVSW